MTRRGFHLCSVILMLLTLVCGANAASYFTGNLTSAQEVPPNASTATGFGRVTLNNTETQITVSVYWSGLSAAATAGHIHGPAAVGANGPVIFNLAPAAATSGSVVNATFAVTAGQVADLKAGLWYYNIHTSTNPGGEIRGQVTADAPYIAYMNGGQENPAVNTTTATGSGAVSINAAGTQAIVTMNWAGLSGNATAGHIHTGRSRTNGAVVCNLTPAAVPTGSVVDFLCNFSPTQITSLRQGQFYFNVHTSANPGGEIRGQIQRRRSTVADFDGDSKTDYAVARNNTPDNRIDWYIANSGSGFSLSAFQMGTSADFSASRITPCDFDGDGKDDFSVWRTGASPAAGFLIFNSATSTVTFEQFGTTSDDPRVAYDYDGDGRCDPAVFRTSTDHWYYRGSLNNPSGNITFVPFGTTFANPGDFDGDGRGDFVDQQGGVWWLLKSSDLSISQIYIGSSASFGVPGDYDGDGKTDVGITNTEGNNLTWYYASSLNPTQNSFLTRQPWGPNAGRIRAQGDYNGDGKSDYGVYITTLGQHWSISSNGTNPTAFQWGISTDFPLTGYNNR